MKTIYTLVLATALVAACNKKKEEPAPAAGSAMAPTPVVVDATAGSAEGSAAQAGSAAQPVDVPTEIDFEDQAAKDINDKNVEARLKKMESDLGQ